MDEQINETVRLIIVAIVSGVIGFITKNWQRPQTLTDEHNKNAASINQLNTDTIFKLNEQITYLIDRDTEKEKRIDILQNQVNELERTNKTYINAYNRAFTFIQKHHAGEEIPDFMITQKLKPM